MLNMMNRAIEKADRDTALKRLKSEVLPEFKLLDSIYSDATCRGYWSNLDKEEETILLSHIESDSCYAVVHERFPNLKDVMFSPLRSAGLRLLDIRKDQIGIDYGCMWGNLLIYCAKRCAAMVGIDKTLGSLKFLKKRLKEEGLDNTLLVHGDIKKDIGFSGTFDFAIVNGVLEWIPEEQDVELKSHLTNREPEFRMPSRDPRQMQVEFLEKVHSSLRKRGKIYLAIENRFDYQYFFWRRDPHPNLFYTSILPRKMSNFISNIYYGRPYVNYTHSHGCLESMLGESGFNNIQKYAAFPNYSYPERIVPFDRKDESAFYPVYGRQEARNNFERLFRAFRKRVDNVLFRCMKNYSLSPAFIFIAEKG